MTATEHLKFVDSEGVEYIVESDHDVTWIRESSTNCEPCPDCQNEIAFYATDVPKIIEALQASLQHHALVGSYQCADLSGVEPKQPGQLCNMETGEHVIPHRGCILR